jgi:hypothetical protein
VLRTDTGSASNIPHGIGVKSIIEIFQNFRRLIMTGKFIATLNGHHPAGNVNLIPISFVDPLHFATAVLFVKKRK